jgi:hypothetical protein
MISLFTVVIVYVLALLAVLFAISKRGRISLYLKGGFVTVAGASVLTYLMLFEFNRRPIFLDEETDAIELLADLEQHTLDEQISLKNDEIILIDVSAHTQLVENKQPLFNDNTAKLLITDRTKLAKLINWLGDSAVCSNIGMVVCDVLLDYPTPFDDTLRLSFQKLISNNKLLVAKQNGMDSLRDDYWFGGTDIGRSVDMIEYDGKYFSQRLLDENHRPTLPYELYRQHKLQAGDSTWFDHASKNRMFWEFSLERTSGDRVSNWFIPDLILTEESSSGKPISEPPTVFGQIVKGFSDFLWGYENRETEASKFQLLPVGLGAATQDEGQQYIIDLLKNARDSTHPKKNKRVTIFVGNFSDERDLHDTAFGKMHGGLIILNTYLNLINQQHFIGGGYIFMIWLFFLLVIARFLWRIQILSTNGEDLLVEWAKKPLRWIASKLKIGASVGITVFMFFEEFVLNLLHYWLLLIILLISVHYAHKLVNMMAIVVILLAVDFSIRTLHKAIHPEK